MAERVTDTAAGAVGLYQHRFGRPPGKEHPSLAVAQNAALGVKPTTSVLAQKADQNEPTGRAYPGGSFGPQVTAVTAGSADGADRGYALAAARQGCSGSATIALRACPLAANLARTRQSRDDRATLARRVITMRPARSRVRRSLQPRWRPQP